MSSLSKLAKTHLVHAKCSDIFHPDIRSCWKSILKDFKSFPIGNAKLFFPFFLIRFLMNLRNLNKKVAYEILKQYWDFTLAGTLMGLGCTMSVCAVRNIVGRFYFTSTLFIPCFISVSMLINYIPQYILRMITITIFENIVEVILRAKADPISRLIDRSKYVQTLLFMTNSSYIIQNLPYQKEKIFWFIKPLHPNEKKLLNEDVIEQVKNPKNIPSKCCHEDKCSNYIIKGLKLYGAIGIILDITKQILSSRNAKDFVLKIGKKILSFDFETTKFLLTYIGVYRALLCGLNQAYPNRSYSLHHNTIAAFFSGISYIFYPKIIFFSYSVICSIQIAWKNYKKTKSNSEFEKRIKVIPWEKYFNAIAIPLSIHLFVFHHQLLGNIGKKFVDGVTNHKSREVLKNVTNFLTAGV